MVGYTHTLEKLGFPIGQELVTDFILASLPPSYGSFISNYHMHGMDKGLNELCGMLKTVETDIKKNAPNHVMMVHKSASFKKKDKSWRRKAAKGKVEDMISKPKPQSEPKTKPRADAECFYCHKSRH